MEHDTFRPPRMEHIDTPRLEHEAWERQERYDLRESYRTDEEAWTDADWERDFASREQDYQHKDDDKI